MIVLLAISVFFGVTLILLAGFLLANAAYQNGYAAAQEEFAAGMRELLDELLGESEPPSHVDHQRAAARDGRQ